MMILNFLAISLVVTIGLVLIGGSSILVSSDNDFTQEQLESGFYVFAEPIGSGIGEGVSADGKSMVSSQYMEYLGNQTSGISASVGASVANGCNCVIFRMDDLQDFFVRDVQVAMMDEFTQRDEFLSIGPIFNDFGNGLNDTVKDTAQVGVTSGLFELFNHGWNHTDFSTFSLAEQTTQLQLGQDKAETIFGSNLTKFVPPFNAFNDDTLDALVATDFGMISSEGVVDGEPHFVADGVSDIKDSRGLYHLPSDVKFINFGVDPPTRIPNSQILDDIDTSIASRGYAVITFHAQDHAEVNATGHVQNVQNVTLMNDLRAIIDGVNLKNYPIRTFAQVLAFNATVSIDDVTQVEGIAGTSNFVFTVTRSNTSGSLSVDYITADDTATSPSDYTSLPTSTLNFADGGLSSRTITVSVNGDPTVESDETFNVNLSNCIGCNISDFQGIGTITNDDAFSTVSINDVTQVEGDSGTSNFVFNITRSNTNNAISVQYQTVDISATSPSDYISLPLATLNFADGGLLSKTISVSVKGDDTAEPNETFNVDLSTCTGCTFTDDQGIGTITNDDFPTVSINDVTQTEGDSGTTDFVFNVTRSSKSGAISLLYQTAPDTASPPSDYTSLPLTALNFVDAGQLSKTIVVSVNGDVSLEPDEKFNVNLSNCTDCTITDNKGVGTLLDDDTAGLHIQTIGSTGTAEGKFDTPSYVAVDSNDRIIVTDTLNNRIQIFDSAGNFVKSIGSLGDGFGEFENPTGIAVDSTDKIIVADSFNHRIQIFTPAGEFIESFGAQGSNNGNFQFPTDIQVDSTDNIIVADSTNNRVQVFNSAGDYQSQFGSFGDGDGEFLIPQGIAVDSTDGIIVSDSGNRRIEIFNSAGLYQSEFGGSGITDGLFRSPSGVAVKSADRIVVADTDNNRIQIFDSSGNHLQSFGSGGDGDGQFNNPSGVAVDSTGRIIVTEVVNDRVQIFHGSPPPPLDDLDSDGISDVIDPENIINSSITLTQSHTVKNVTVKNGAVLTIPSGLSLTIIPGSNLTVESGGGVLVKLGGTLQFNS